MAKISVGPQRYGLVLRCHDPAIAMGGALAGPRVKALLEDIGFQAVRVFAPVEGAPPASLPPEARAALAAVGAPFPSWLLYAEAEWTRGLATIEETNELFSFAYLMVRGAASSEPLVSDKAAPFIYSGLALAAALAFAFALRAGGR